MSETAIKQLGTITLSVVTDQRDEKGQRIVRPLYLVHEGNRPVKLGSGRYATVIAAANSAELENATEFFALKFLKWDPSPMIMRNIRSRFFQEIVRTRQFSAYDGLISYRGFSRVKMLDKGGTDVDMQQRNFEVELNKDGDALTLSTKSNVEEAKSLKDFLNSVHGEFFAMPALEGSLEDFLFYERPWSERPLYTLFSSYKRAIAPVLARRDEIATFLKNLADPRQVSAIRARDAEARKGEKSPPPLPRDCRGMTILNYIGRCAPSIRNRIVVDLVESVATTLASLHEKPAHDRRDGAPSDEPVSYLAHRDMKPGNVLFGFVTTGTPVLKLSDLGFVGSTSVSLLESLGGNVREPGVLPLGSILFRGPEQIVPCVEVRFEIDPDSMKPSGEKRPPLTVTFHDIGGIVDPKPGDLLECQELEFHNSGDTKATIARVDRGEQDLVTITLNDGLESNRNGGEFNVGYVVKASGQHTDIFALGSMLYLLATGGRSPESFYLKCLESTPTQVGDSREDGEPGFYREFHGSCLSLAMSLCLSDEADIVNDLEAYSASDREVAAQLAVANRVRPSVIEAWNDQRRPPHTWERNLVVEKKRRPTAEQLLAKHVPNHSSKGKEDLVRYVRYWRQSPTVQHYLTDVTGQPLPFPIVYEIVRCMVRDKEDSYVTRGEDTKSRSFQDLQLQTKVADIARSLRNVVQRAPSVQPNINAYGSYGSWLKLFFCARMCYERQMTRSMPITRVAEPTRKSDPQDRGMEIGS
ncbi:MAG TPA: hypothetical protein VFD82_18030 [Planctomycetota bacterium]|nr:hypothetical protein [Planctomycetota bacterium]